MSKIKEIEVFLELLGSRLRTARLQRNDTMAIFAERLSVSERTVRAMERGAPTVQIGTWIEAIWILDRMDEMSILLAPKESLIDLARAKRKPVKQRASRRRR